MSLRRRFALAAAIGALVFAAHLGVFPTLLGAVGGDSLIVRVDSPRVAASLDTSAQVPRALEDRVVVDVRPGGPDIAGPGMHRIEWSVRYRGGFERRVGRTQLVGPFQDLEQPPCALRILLGQTFLDGVQPRARQPLAGPFANVWISVLDTPRPGSLAALIGSMIETQMRGFEQWPIGEFRDVHGVSMRWLNIDDIEDQGRRRAVEEVAAAARATATEPAQALAGSALAGSALAGILRTSMTLRFTDGEVPVWIAIIPQITGTGLSLSAHVIAEVDLDSWFYQKLSDWFDGDELATETAQNELDQALASVLGLPPPIELGDGHRLRFAYCDSEPMDIVTGRYAAIPVRLLHESRSGVAPIFFGSPGKAARERLFELDAPLAIEFELDALNGILHELWRSGFLDRHLDRIGLDGRFNDSDLVRELLSVRLGELELALPPTLWWQNAERAGPADTAGLGQQPDLYLGVEADLQIHDRDATTPAHLFGAVGLALHTGQDAPLVADLTLRELALTCEPEAGVLVPCYNDLVRAVRDRASDIHGELTERFTALVSDIVLDRHVDVGQASFRIERSQVHTQRDAPSSVLRVDLYGRIRGAK